jgi:hypothetical protein
VTNTDARRAQRLDEKQKKAFDTGGRVGGILDWLRNKID